MLMKARNAAPNHAKIGHPSSPAGRLLFSNWKSIFKRAYRDMNANNVSLIAAGVAFYGLLSLFPLLLALVSIYSLFADPLIVETQLKELATLIPHEAQSIISHQLHEVVQNSSTTLGWSTFLSIGAALWSASRGST